MSDLREYGKEVNCQGERFISNKAVSAVKPSSMYMDSYVIFCVLPKHCAYLYSEAPILAEHFKNIIFVCRNILCSVLVH